jgi:single-stranded-DNA-specific exonuclease
VGIVAGRIAEKHSKPALIMSINSEEWVAMGSLRWPERFNIVEMLKTADEYLLRYGGHAQAWGMTITLESLPLAIECFLSYCVSHPAPDATKTTIAVDTPIYEHEMNRAVLKDILTFWPYGEGNPEPLFVLENTIITNASTVGKKGNGHLKLAATKESISFTSLQRGKGDTVGDIVKNTPLDLIWKIKEDTFNWWRYMEAKHILQRD